VAKAEKLLDDRLLLDDGSILALRLWRVPQPVPPATHRFKYALFYGRPGERLVLFDNERGKGDHKHIREVETPYVFEGPERLIADFLEAVRAVRGEGP
jgi:Family of unknown function (DUF6516)